MSSEGAINNSQIVERVDKTTRTGRRIAEIKLQNGRWIQIWDQNFDKTPNQFFSTAIVGAVCSWNSELRAVDGKVGYYKQPGDLHIIGSQTHTTVPNYQHLPAPIQQNIQPQPAAPQQQIRADYAVAQAEKERKIKEMAARRDSIAERQIAAMDNLTNKLEKFIAALTFYVTERVPIPNPGYPDYADELNSVSDDDIKAHYEHDDEEGY